MHPWNDTELPPHQRACLLLEQLNLKEKITQLGSHWYRSEDETPAAGQGPESDDSHHVAPMAHVFNQTATSWVESRRDGLGHLTRPFGTEPLTVARGRQRLAKLQQDVVASSRFGIPALAHEECLTGLTALGATVYPAAIAWGATWRPELVQEMASAIGSDMAALGIQQGLSPLLDVVRDYRWGRVEETCGEDPYLVGTLGTAYVRGLQSAGVDATLKHFAGYPASRAGRNHAPVSMGPRELEDVMLPPFEMAVREGGVRSVMNSYCDIDGVPATASRHLLTEVLRERWGFTGVTVSDYWSIDFLAVTHGVASDPAGAAAKALSAGMDVALPTSGAYGELARSLAHDQVTMAQIDAAVLRVLEQKRLITIQGVVGV